MEYLEDKFPAPPLLPAEPESRARVRLLQRIGEIQIMTPLVELARQADPASRDPSAAMWLTRLIRGFSSLQLYVGDEAFAHGSSLTIADCELAPALFMVTKFAAAFDKPALLQAYPLIARYLARQPKSAGPAGPGGNRAGLARRSKALTRDRRRPARPFASPPHGVKAPDLLRMPYAHDSSRQHQQAERPPDPLHRGLGGAPERREGRPCRPQRRRQDDAVPDDHGAGAARRGPGGHRSRRHHRLFQPGRRRDGRAAAPCPR